MEWNMDNDNKIKISKKEVRLFLQKDMLPPENDAPEFFDLEAEYAKTRKGKSHFTVWVLIICTLSVALLVYGVTSWISYKNESLSVGVDVFEDLNLKNLLDVVSRTEASMETAVNQKVQLETDRDAELSKASIKRDSEILRLETLKISSAERKRRNAAIQSEYESSLALISEKYDSDIAKVSKQIEEYQQQLASYDRKNVELAQEQEAAMNSQRRLFELEKQKLTDDYKKTITDLNNQLSSLGQKMMEEQRKTVAVLNNQYAKEISLIDPQILDERANSVIEDMQSYTDVFSVNNFYLNVSDPILMENALSKIANIEKQYSDFNHLSQLIKDTPWKNSLGGYVNTITNLGNKIGIETVNAAIDLLHQQELNLKQMQAKYEQEKQDLFAKIAKLENGEEILEQLLKEEEETPIEETEVFEEPLADEPTTEIVPDLDSEVVTELPVEQADLQNEISTTQLEDELVVTESETLETKLLEEK